MGLEVDLDQIALRFGVSVDELAQLYAYGTSAWRAMEREFPSPQIERTLIGREIHGHVDVISVGPGAIVINDWKSNRIKREYREQLVGYAAAAVEEFGWPESGLVKIVTTWLRFGEMDVEEITSDEVDALYHRISDAERDIGTRYGPGSACKFCRRQLVCGARQEYMQAAATAIATVGTVDLNPDMLPLFFERARMLGGALEQYRQALKLYLKEHGPTEDGAGLMLELGETKLDKIIPKLAWDYLVDNGFTEDELAHCMSMSKTKIMEVAGGKAKRGLKGKVKAALLAALREGNAVVATFSESVLARKIKP
jgi:hypothetical protein